VLLGDRFFATHLKGFGFTCSKFFEFIFDNTHYLNPFILKYMPDRFQQMSAAWLLIPSLSRRGQITGLDSSAIRIHSSSR
jgi:hypothetical protein